MDFDDLHPADDYSHRFFIWHEWIQANGPLTTENVFDYFATSMYYDKQSNNQVLRMQTMHTGQPILNEAEELKRFTGIEFALVHAQPPSLFIIHKRERLSPEEVRPLAAYFIVYNRIYPSPDLYTVLSNRLLTTVHALQSSLDTLRAHRPDFTPRTGFIWPIVDTPNAEALSKKRLPDHPSETGNDSGSLLNIAKQSEKSSGNLNIGASAKKQENILPLLRAMQTTALHSNASFSAPEITDEIPETSGSFTRTSATPGTQSTREATPLAGSPPKSSIPDATISAKPSAIGSKKKRKRMSTVATPIQMAS
ncbi:MED6-domain-containing [Pyrrhoderma noxium]|uniref:Mediator of RNA polymerase II transcription subunit 6 n=1 Tax=Pyrrhoderma noxium TaxID=2282107 RepID=A0A286UQV3_9AGAM|nr:MED6-domain-containing [Pyrrhoderma noxium]